MRPHRRALLILGGMLFWTLLWGGAWAISAQAPTPLSLVPEICLIHPDTILRNDPAGRPVVAWVRPSGFPVQVPAREYLRQNFRQAPLEAISVAVQYSIAMHRQSFAAAREVSLRAYAPDDPTVPDVSLHAALWGYLWSGHPVQRSALGHALMRAVESSANKDCNLWRPERGGGPR